MYIYILKIQGPARDTSLLTLSKIQKPSQVKFYTFSVSAWSSISHIVSIGFSCSLIAVRLHPRNLATRSEATQSRKRPPTYETSTDGFWQPNPNSREKDLQTLCYGSRLGPLQPELFQEDRCSLSSSTSTLLISQLVAIWRSDRALQAAALLFSTFNKRLQVVTLSFTITLYFFRFHYSGFFVFG